MGLKSRSTDFLVNMSASADVLAQAKVEIDLKAIPEGKNVRINHSAICSKIYMSGYKALKRELNRSSSNGEANQSSSGTAPKTRSKKQRTRNGNHYVTRNRIRIVSRSRNG